MSGNGLTCYLINAFTDQPSGGNPAGVIALEEWLPTDLMQKIARENGVAETAFFIPKGRDYELRWFTPEIEMDLCGHATLATAFVIRNYLDAHIREIQFASASGRLKVDCTDDSWLAMDFPSRAPVPSDLPAVIRDSLNIQPREVLKSRDYVLVYDSEKQIREINPNQQVLDQVNLDPGGVIFTAPGVTADFVSRFFTPQSSIFEDPVTGSAHCSLIPYWADILGKDKMLALQLSDRLGTLHCTNLGHRVLIAGQCYTDAVKEITIE